ncbi:DUF2391 family protein [Haloplanus aerogenes]|uniref:DUF2391 family protein n=1 Tax=Haloplanus aerogenes TaxID=660522 RepID=A0A3M0CW67_9EURY|nr:DUF2391 family protein [Haloplanus aerogenes]AZH26997.1 DUF2391 family protein [Haloplanus aerogenes]RMB13512.1 putative integral membrane protein DUF2391 [Haloplanus aerogenes]
MSDAEGDGASDGGVDADESADMGDLFDELQELEDLVMSDAAREQVRETMRVAMVASAAASPFGRVIRGFDRSDLTEALLGSLLFGIPMAVEGGTQEVGTFLAPRPGYLAGTFLFAVGMVIGIIYVADFQDVRVHKPIFGLIPRRLVGVIGVSLLMATLILTGWGRVDWTEPSLAAANIVVAFVPMSIGAALGDLLPGS